MFRLLSAIFPPAIRAGSGAGAWPSPAAQCSCGGIVHAIRFEPDKAWAAIVLSQCTIGFSGTLALYAGLAVADDKFKRDTEAKAQTGQS